MYRHSISFYYNIYTVLLVPTVKVDISSAPPKDVVPPLSPDEIVLDEEESADSDDEFVAADAPAVEVDRFEMFCLLLYYFLFHTVNEFPFHMRAQAWSLCGQ